MWVCGDDDTGAGGGGGWSLTGNTGTATATSWDHRRYDVHLAVDGTHGPTRCINAAGLSQHRRRGGYQRAGPLAAGAVIGGGSTNVVNNGYATVAGGEGNTAGGLSSTVTAAKTTPPTASTAASAEENNAASAGGAVIGGGALTYRQRQDATVQRWMGQRRRNSPLARPWAAGGLALILSLWTQPVLTRSLGPPAPASQVASAIRPAALGATVGGGCYDDHLGAARTWQSARPAPSPAVPVTRCRHDYTTVFGGVQ